MMKEFLDGFRMFYISIIFYRLLLGYKSSRGNGFSLRQRLSYFFESLNGKTTHLIPIMAYLNNHD